MAIEKRQVSVAKEVDDVLALLVALVKNRKNKESLTNLVGDLMTAISGLDQIDDEMSMDRKAVLETVGIRIAELTDVLLGA